MDQYRRMAVFAKVVEAGSMSGAARALGMTTSAVSQQIRQLELEARVTLLWRWPDSGFRPRFCRR